MAQITTLDTVSKLLKYVTITLPPFVTKSDDSYIRQFLSSILEVFKINVDQLNQMFNNTFISEAEEGDLEKLILDVSNVTRKDGETDEDYRNRFYKYVYRYNATANSIEEIVYDTLGYYPIKLTESGARTAYWGLHDLVVEDRVANSAYFYDDVNEYTAYWGRYQSQQSSENEKYFVGIIHLTERPPQEKLDELCDVIERVRKKGTKIYLQFLDNIDIILEPVVAIVEEDAFTFAWRLVPSAFSYEVQIDDDPLFGSPTTYITSSTSYNFSGLSGGVTYYTRVRYENDDGYSEWTEPVETTTVISLGTPIATEETNVGVSGKLTNIFTANWGSASGATSYILTIAEDLSLTVPISNYNQQNLGNSVLENVVLDLETDAYELISWKLQDNNSSIVSSIGGNLSGTLNGTQNWLSSLISSDTYSLKLNGTTNRIQTTNQNTTLDDFTIRLLLRFEVGDKASLSEHTLFSRYNTNLSSPSSAGAIFYTSYDSTINKLNLVIFDSSDTFVSPKYRVWSCDFNPIEGIDYLLQFSFKKADPSNSNLNKVIFCINGISKSLTNNDSISNINNLKVFNLPYYLGAYVGMSGTYFYGKFRCERAYFSTRFRTEVEALKDAKNLGLSPQTLYYGVKATDGVNTSPYSNVITVNKDNIVGDLEIASSTKIAYMFNNNLLDSSGNGNTAIPYNGASFASSPITSESYSLYLDGKKPPNLAMGNAQYIQFPNTATIGQSFTIRSVLKFDYLEDPTTLTLFSQFNDGVGAKFRCLYFRSGSTYTIELHLYHSTYPSSSNALVKLFANVPAFNTTDKYFIQIGWDQVNPSGGGTASLFINGNSYTLSKYSGANTTANLILNDTNTVENYIGAYKVSNVVSEEETPKVRVMRFLYDNLYRTYANHLNDYSKIVTKF